MSKHYSNIPFYDESTVTTNWNQIELSPRTVQERKKVKLFIDDFASFTWRGIDAFETFGAFIINNKNSLKFYNGPSFTNEYTKPQFETAAGQLTGVTFQIQKIDFMIGVYWISEEDYRQMIYWLHPYEINTLTFGFEPNYYYQVKLSSVDNGNRIIVGYEDGQPMYYTEMKITFEVQGAPVAYGNTYFSFDINRNNIDLDVNKQLRYECQIDTLHDERVSDLETPIIIETTIDLAQIQQYQSVPTVTDNDLLLSAYALYDSEDPVSNPDKIKLFEVVFKNLTFGAHLDGTPNTLNITYNSESALLFLQHGDSMRELLTRLTALTSGDRLVDSLSVEQFRIPGKFDDYQFDFSKMKIFVTLEILNINFKFVNNPSFDIGIYSRPRTNLI